MLVTNERIEQLADEWSIEYEGRQEAIDFAIEVRDIYENRLKEIMEYVEQAEKLIKELKEQE